MDLFKKLFTGLRFFFFVAIFFLFYSCSKSEDFPMEKLPNEDVITSISELYKDLDITMIAAHRCYYKNYPENSLAAIQDGIDLGIEFLEVDTRTTADGVVIMFHDATVNRVTSGSGKVADMFFSSISQLKLKDKNGVLTEEHIATLEQGFLKIKGENIYMHVEVKDDHFDEVIKIIRKTEMQNQVLLFIPDKTNYDLVSKYNDIYVDVVCKTSENFNFYSNQPNVICMNLAGSIFNASYTAKAKNNGKLTWRGITDKPDENELTSSSISKPNLAVTIQKNPSIIHTDNADLLMSYLEQKGKR